MNQKRRFTPEFKKEAVALVIEQDYTIAKAAVSLGISAKTLSEPHRVSGRLNSQ